MQMLKKTKKAVTIELQICMFPSKHYAGRSKGQSPLAYVTNLQGYDFGTG